MKTVLQNLKEIQKEYKSGTNIIKFINGSRKAKNSSESILVSYDLQAGTYVDLAKNHLTYLNNYTSALAKEIDLLGSFNSILEVGVGEGTTLAHLVSKFKKKPKTILGFDISWSRIKYANNYLLKNSIKNSQLFVGDLFRTPLMNDSVDIVYTSHSIEPNGGREKESLRELYRITKSYLILLEPSWEFASRDGKKRIEELGYVKNLYKHAKDLGYKVIKHQLFEYSANPLNPTGLIIIEKKSNQTNSKDIFACPVTKTKLAFKDDCYYSADSLLAYPIIGKIPCLTPDNAVVATHFLDRRTP